MITNFFIPELNNHDLQELWFQQDGATCHTARATIDLLKDTFGGRLISRFGPVNWPPRSCDLTPLDYFLWGYVKSLVYADKPQTLDHLEDNIRRVIADIRPQMLEKVIENWTSRLDYIRASRGSPMPEIIFKIDIVNLSKLALCWKKKKVPVANDIIPDAEDSKKSTDDSSSEGSLPADRKKTATLTRRKTFHGQIPVDRKNPPIQPARFSRPRRSISDESTISSASSLVGANQNLSMYDQGIDKLMHDDRWKKETTLGTRISFYRLYRDVGKGNFSKVKMAVHYLTKEKVAVKIIDKTKLQPKSKQMLSKEISAMESIQHPHIIRLYEVIETPSKLFLAMEFAEGGELFHKVANGGRIPEVEAKILFAQLTSAVEYLNSKLYLLPQPLFSFTPPSTLRSIFLSKDAIRFSSSFAIVQVSDAYVRTDRIRVV
ncbi:hypothetical protein TNCV_2769421 [Trichonephila clavipes]|nr:hypothetical protein TNCV_2769421 [Trichonephila clavipes]